MSTEEKIKVKRRAFKVASQINHGGIATIYEAYNSEGDRVVLRELRKELRFKRRMRQMFLKGVSVRRELGHNSNIVRYLAEGGCLQPFEILEYVPCSNLKQLAFKRDKIVKEHAVSILQQIADALALVHSHGYLHLDVKPENVLVLTSGELPLVKLTDFDLCQPLTKTQAPKNAGGSLAYLPPEYLKDKQISISTDVFSFGVLAYYLFTTQMPFVGSVSANMTHGNYDIKFPETQDGVVPKCVADFIRRCLAPLPMHRFCDDSELRIGLRVLARELAEDEPTARNDRRKNR